MKGRLPVMSEELLAYHIDSVTAELSDELRRQGRLYGKSVVCGAVFDTIKAVSAGVVAETLNRDELRWPLAWACRPELAPETDPPSATWFVGAAVLESRL